MAAFQRPARQRRDEPGQDRPAHSGAISRAWRPAGPGSAGPPRVRPHQEERAGGHRAFTVAREASRPVLGGRVAESVRRRALTPAASRPSRPPRERQFRASTSPRGEALLADGERRRCGSSKHRLTSKGNRTVRDREVRATPLVRLHRPRLICARKGRHHVSAAGWSRMNLSAHVRVGKTSLDVPRVGVGTAPLGNMFEALSDEHADAVLASAVGHGLRYFDTAPLYGHGLAEQRVGRAVAGLPREEVFVSTKVGRLLRADAPRDESQFYQGEPFYKDVPPVGPVWDFPYDGVMRSVEESFRRTGLDRFDVLLLHDPDDHFKAASTTGFRALPQLREDGTARAIGAGMNQVAMLARLVYACVLDVLLVAGRYTLLDQVAMDELLPLCEQR